MNIFARWRDFAARTVNESGEHSELRVDDDDGESESWERKGKSEPCRSRVRLAGHDHDGRRPGPRQSASYVESHFRFLVLVASLGAKSVLGQGLSIHRPIIYGNTASILTPKEKESAPETHTHRWTVAIRSATSSPDSDIVGGADDLGYLIKRVTFKLHDTYQNPTRGKSKKHPSPCALL